MRQVSHIFRSDFKPETSTPSSLSFQIPWVSCKPSNQGSDTLDRVSHWNLSPVRNLQGPLCTTLSSETSTSSSLSLMGSRTSEKLRYAAFTYNHSQRVISKSYHKIFRLLSLTFSFNGSEDTKFLICCGVHCSLKVVKEGSVCGLLSLISLPLRVIMCTRMMAAELGLHTNGKYSRMTKRCIAPHNNELRFSTTKIQCQPKLSSFGPLNFQKDQRFSSSALRASQSQNRRNSSSASTQSTLKTIH